MLKPHCYDAPDLESTIKETVKVYDGLTKLLHKIQEATKIPGLHTDINSDDDSLGVLERIQAMQENDEHSLAAFIAFDEE
jgi:hypothetical protein